MPESNCKVCGRPDNRIQIRSGTKICCELCDKIRKGDISRDSALDYLWSINTEVALSNYYSLGGLVRASTE